MRDKTKYDRKDNAKRVVEDLEQGRCRFNCRTAKENWMQGYIEAQHNAARGVKFDAIEAWNDHRKR